MAKHVMLIGVSADKKGILLFRAGQYTLWNGLTARVDESVDVLDAATRVFKTVTTQTVQGWSKLAVIKDESLSYSVHVLFTVINEETERALGEQRTSEDGDITWDWWATEELPSTMHNVQWLVPLIFDRQLKRPLHVMYHNDKGVAAKKSDDSQPSVGRRRNQTVVMPA